MCMPKSSAMDKNFTPESSIAIRQFHMILEWQDMILRIATTPSNTKIVHLSGLFMRTVA